MPKHTGNECVVRFNMPLTERPRMKDLNRYLTDYCEFWRSIGLKLSLQASVLNLIEADHRHQQRECFRTMLQRWLQQDVDATWRKLELAITNARREFNGLDSLDAMPDHCSVGSASPKIRRRSEETDFHDASSQQSRHKKCKVMPDNGATAGVKQPQPSGNKGDKGSTTDGMSKKTSKYQTITTSTPMCAVVINNQTFGKESGLAERKGSSKDVESLQVLKDYGLEFHLCPENCKAEEMTAILSVIASSNDLQKHLRSATKRSKMSEALEKFETDGEIRTTIKCLTTEDCKDALETATRNKEMKETTLKILEKPLSEYHGLIVFIMTHGDEGGKLFGSDGKHITVAEIVSLFNDNNCPELINKPKIFVIHACREDEDSAKVDGAHSTNTPSGNKGTSPSLGVVSPGADCLLVYSHYVGKDGSPFIQSLVEVLDERLNGEHFQDTLFSVKDKVASKNNTSDGKACEQIPTVISRMTDRVWFHK